MMMHMYKLLPNGILFILLAILLDHYHTFILLDDRPPLIFLYHRLTILHFGFTFPISPILSRGSAIIVNTVQEVAYGLSIPHDQFFRIAVLIAFSFWNLHTFSDDVIVIDLNKNAVCCPFRGVKLYLVVTTWSVRPLGTLVAVLRKVVYLLMADD